MLFMMYSAIKGVIGLESNKAMLLTYSSIDNHNELCNVLCEGDYFEGLASTGYGHVKIKSSGGYLRVQSRRESPV